MKEKYGTIIVGGGVTGLHLAKLLGHQQPLVISVDYGGLLNTYEDGPFKFDYGGHVYTAQDTRVSDLLMNARAITHERVAVYLHKHGRVPYPVQDHASKLGIDIETRPKANKIRYTDLQDLALGYFGQQFYDEFFAPFNRRVWTVDPTEMSTDWIATRVKLPSETRENWGPNASFHYAPGTNIVTTLIREAVEAGARLIGGEVVGVDLERKELRLANKDVLGFDNLYWTASIKNVAPLVDISRTSFVGNRVLSVGIGFRNILSWDHFNWGYFDVDLRPHRITWLSRYHPTMSPNGQDSVLIEFPYRIPDYPLPQYLAGHSSSRGWVSHEEVGRRVGVKALADGGMTFHQHQIDVVSVGESPGYPIPTHSARPAVAEAKRRLRKHNVFLAGRWGDWGYYNINHCFDSAQAAIEHDADVGNYLHSRFYYGSI